MMDVCLFHGMDPTMLLFRSLSFLPWSLLESSLLIGCTCYGNGSIMCGRRVHRRKYKYTSKYTNERCGGVIHFNNLARPTPLDESEVWVWGVGMGGSPPSAVQVEVSGTLFLDRDAHVGDEFTRASRSNAHNEVVGIARRGVLCRSGERERV